MSTPTVAIYAGPAEIAQATAQRLLDRLTAAQSGGGSASVVLTGGRIAARLYEAVRDNPNREQVDWSRVDVWWGDERFLPAGDPERNETQARAALLDAVGIDPTRVHPMPPSDGADGNDPEAAAIRYGDVLAGAVPHLGRAVAHPGDDHGRPAQLADGLPRFDLVLLGVGEDGHVASVFPTPPEQSLPRPVSGPASAETPATGPEGWVAAVRDSPKPPPVRLTLTLAALNTATEVWLIAAGPDKADAVQLARMPGAAVPAGRVNGTATTLWILDHAAAARLPDSHG